MKTQTCTLIAGLVLALAAGAAQADTKPANSRCFATNSWRGWTANKAGDALFLRMDNNDVYRVDLIPGSHARKYPGTFLVNQVRGSNWICSHLDLDLTLADDIGVRQPLIARSMRLMSPAEVAALPPKERP
jgi:hypothetical protein